MINHDTNPLSNFPDATAGEIAELFAAMASVMQSTADMCAMGVITYKEARKIIGLPK